VVVGRPHWWNSLGPLHLNPALAEGSTKSHIPIILCTEW